MQHYCIKCKTTQYNTPKVELNGRTFYLCSSCFIEFLKIAETFISRKEGQK